MSHFTVLVITDSEPTNEVLSATLQPFHEYECTGIDDVYVRDVDRTRAVGALRRAAPACVVMRAGFVARLRTR